MAKRLSQFETVNSTDNTTYIPIITGAQLANKKILANNLLGELGITNYLQLSGGTLTGNVIMSGATSVTAPTVTGTTDSTHNVATTEFVQAQKVNPIFTGIVTMSGTTSVTAPTVTGTTDNSNKVATTAFVQAQKVNPIFTGTVKLPAGYLEELGTNYIMVSGKGTPAENAVELSNAYTKAKTIGATVSNRVTIVIAPGYYTFVVDGSFTISTNYIDFVSLTGNADVIINGAEVIANDVFIKGINTGIFPFAQSGGGSLSVFENCISRDNSFGGSSGAVLPTYTGVYVSDDGDAEKYEIGRITPYILDFMNSADEYLAIINNHGNFNIIRFYAISNDNPTDIVDILIDYSADCYFNVNNSLQMYIFPYSTENDMLNLFKERGDSITCYIELLNKVVENEFETLYTTSDYNEDIIFTPGPDGNGWVSVNVAPEYNDMVSITEIGDVFRLNIYNNDYPWKSVNLSIPFGSNAYWDEGIIQFNLNNHILAYNKIFESKTDNSTLTLSIDILKVIPTPSVYIFSGTAINCIGGNYSFGSSLDGEGMFDGTATRCIAKGYSFGYGGITGTFTSGATATNCTAGDYSFGGDGGTFSGAATNCTGGDNSFGGIFTGVAKFCETTGVFPTTSGNGKIILCINNLGPVLTA